MALRINLKIRKNDNDDQAMPDVEFFWWDQETEKIVNKDENKIYPFFQNFEPSFYFKTSKDRNMGWDHDFIEEIDKSIKKYNRKHMPNTYMGGIL